MATFLVGVRRISVVHVSVIGLDSYVSLSGHAIIGTRAIVDQNTYPVFVHLNFATSLPFGLT